MSFPVPPAPVRRALIAVPVLAAAAIMTSGDAGSSANVRLVDVTSTTTTSTIRAATITTTAVAGDETDATTVGTVHTSNPVAVEIGEAVVLERGGTVRTR